MYEIFSKLAEQWAVVWSAPYPFVLALLSSTGAIWFVVHNLIYGTVLNNKNSQIEVLNGRLAAYQDKLKGATPDQAASEIQVLQEQLAETRNHANRILAPKIEPSETTGYEWKPIYLAIEHISERIDDRDSEHCWPRARNTLRQAAYDKRVRIRGRKQLADATPRIKYSDIYTDVDNGYWAVSEINALATSRDNQTDYHANPQTAYAWGKLGLDEPNRYAEFQVNWADIAREWPP